MSAPFIVEEDDARIYHTKMERPLFTFLLHF
jgi:hypothetical protein